MKRLFTLLLLTLAAFSLKTNAQPGTVCNADFNFVVNGYNVQFNPVIIGDSLYTQHNWNFGDATPNSSLPAPGHTYSAPGTYNVKHIIKKINPNGVLVCSDTVIKSVLIQYVCNLQAYFIWHADSLNYLKIYFQNMTQGLDPTDSVKWTFGDGTSSLDVNPVHTYANAGTYTVCLRVKKNNSPPGVAPCVSEICKPVIVTAPCNLIASFTWQRDSLNFRKYYFHNTSTPSAATDSLFWNFGDGSTLSGVQGNSAVANPDHIYNVAGVYVVCLKVKKASINSATPCVRDICYTIVIQEPCNLQANFVWHADLSNAQKIYFTNTTIGLSNTDSIRWTFGDGTASNAVSPDHIYTQPGTYTVCLRVQKRTASGGLANCVSEICKQVYVQAACNFTVNWSWRVDSINSKKIYFTNLTASPTAGAIATWNFGDGTSATSWNAVHEYAQPGRYYVCLKVQFSPNCIKYKCDTVTVPTPAPPCNNQSNFSFVKASNDNQKYTFTPLYQSPAAIYTWTFGDGTGSHDMIATHRYAQPGVYTVCLTVWRSSTCASTTCKTIQVLPQINCDSVQVTYTYQKDPFVPNKVYFYAISNYPVLDQTWTIRKMPLSATGTPVILHQNNPVYVFPDTGYYQVCLRAVTLGGCIKEYCSVIHITQVGNTQCTLQAYPNPATTQVSVNVTLGGPQMIDVYIYNSLNILVKEKHQQGVTGNNVVTVPIADLSSGQYNMKVIHGNDICYSHFQKL